MDNHKLFMILIDWFLYFSNHDKNEIFIFLKKTCMKILEFSRMHTNKKHVFVFFEIKEFFWNSECFFFLKFGQNKVYLIIS